MNKQSNTTTLDLRVGRLEGTMEQIQKDVQENSRVLEDLTQTIGIFKDSIMSKIGQATAPKWPIIISIGSLIMTILLLVGGGFTIVMSGQTEAIKTIQADVDINTKNRMNEMYEQGQNASFKESIGKHLIRTDNFIEDIREKQISVLKTISHLEAHSQTLDEQIKIVDNRRYGERGELIQHKLQHSTTQGVDKLTLP